MRRANLAVTYRISKQSWNTLSCSQIASSSLPSQPWGVLFSLVGEVRIWNGGVSLHMWPKNDESPEGQHALTNRASSGATDWALALNSGRLSWDAVQSKSGIKANAQHRQLCGVAPFAATQVIDL
jgi:hypothetical protein